MVSRLCLIFFAGLVCIATAAPNQRGSRLLDRYVCNVKISKNYKVPDPMQCDRFAICKDGNKTIELCQDGFGYNKNSGECVLLHQVDCNGRPRLQEPTKPSSDCPRANGDFPIRGTCDKYVNCVNGLSYQRDCPAGTTFDHAASTCVHPGQAKRKDCQLSRALGNFSCPVIDIVDRDRGEVKFGDHYRLPFPGDKRDCSKYVICPQNREPKVLSCPKPKVFDPDTGFCQLHVKGCEDFYKTDDVSKDLAVPVDPFEGQSGNAEGEEEIQGDQEEEDFREKRDEFAERERDRQFQRKEEEFQREEAKRFREEGRKFLEEEEGYNREQLQSHLQPVP